MSCRIRHSIFDKLLPLIKRSSVYYELEVTAKKQKNIGPAFHLNFNGTKAETEYLLNGINFDKEIIKNVCVLPVEKEKNPTKIEFQIEPQACVESLLSPNRSYTKLKQVEHTENVVVEFSSPNIAKPFHVGHLRSTIIGNVLANLHKELGHNVTKLNYLGDWGTQFGMLQVGVELNGVTDEQMQIAPIETLYKAYVAANTAAKTDATIAERARRYFADLETLSNSELARQWEKYREYTIQELEETYARLSVRFDHYEWESQYSQSHIGDIIERLSQCGLLLDEVDGRKVVEVDGRRIPVIKSDGSTLYLTRDIAALLDRFQRFKFDRILYIVENGQADHFNACFKTTAALCPDINLDRLRHVKFGRIHGMSTRSGNAVFLRDVLNEAQDIMFEKQLNAATTKVELSEDVTNPKSIADILGVSAVIVNDLKQRRQRDYNFDWQKTLQVNGDTGIKLQYTHCRLHSLLENMGHINTDAIIPNAEYLREPEAMELVCELLRYEHILWQSKTQLEACILVNYLFALCNATSRALKRLNVKHEICQATQENRILLFKAVKSVLQQGMKILGLKPLTKM